LERPGLEGGFGTSKGRNSHPRNFGEELLGGLIFNPREPFGNPQFKEGLGKI